MKKLVLKICSLILIALLSVCLASCEQEKEIVADETFEIHTELQRNFLENDYELVNLYATGSAELSKPNPVVIKWSIDNALDVKEYSFVLSEFEDFTSPRTFIVEKNEISLINLKIHTLYYWYVEYVVNGNLNKTAVKTFVINNVTPRNLDIEGITNVRDLGGYKLDTNKYIKQGMIYRSSKFNDDETSDLLITENGVEVLSKNIIKEIDDIERYMSE